MQMPQFQQDQHLHRQYDNSLDLIEKLSVLVLKIELNWVEKLKGCGALKEQLYRLLIQLRELMSAENQLEPINGDRPYNQKLFNNLPLKIMIMSNNLQSLLPIEILTVVGLGLTLLAAPLIAAIGAGFYSLKALEKEKELKQAIKSVKHAIDQIK